MPSVPLAPVSSESVTLSTSADLPTEDSALPGRLIIVEGIDGSGKSTQLNLLRK